MAADHQRGEAAKGWRSAGFAEAAFLFVKTIAVAPRQRLHHGIFRVAGLQKHQARLLGTAGAARYLVQQLKRSLAGAQVTVAAAKIGIHHAHQGQLRKVMALGHDLGADQHIDLAARE